MKKRGGLCALAFALVAASGLHSQELPVPSSKNATIVSLEHSPLDSAEVEYIKTNFDFGLYAWPSFSVTAVSLELPWRTPLGGSDAGIRSFKDEVRDYVEAARAKNVRLHLVLVAGLCRSPGLYKEAMTEDIRNCQWYNDNKLAADDQIGKSDALETYVFGTLSRYARKVRANLEAKARAGFAFLRGVIADHPETLIAVSGWGESELNYRRIDDLKSVQDYFCDYSPFVVLEFRDWLRHTGEYDDIRGKFKGQGYAQGGSRYQGVGGLARLSADFGTDFTTWDLRYFHWSREDDFDEVPEDAENDDPGRIPYAEYAHGRMRPADGPHYISGGFDPPRTMSPGNKWWDLWNLFRETMVANYVRDAAVWARESGIAPDRWFSHQIPADHIFGTTPATPNKNPRYYSSASPLWTADIRPYGGIGATIYDVKFPDWVARSTDTALPAVAAISPLWAIMEYDPETYPPGFKVSESSSDFILGQYLRVYEQSPYLINFWRWIDNNGEHRIKGRNKETALREFIRRIRDKGRNKDLAIVFTPPQVVGLSGGRQRTGGTSVELRLSGKIWDGHPWEWREWGDFLHFEIYKGTEPEFPAAPAYLLAATKETLYRDEAVKAGRTYYYKVRAANIRNTAGPLSKEIKVKS